jgi:DNA-binding response OmpR family regulator
MALSPPANPAVNAALDIRSILIVDDDSDLSDALKSILVSRNYVVTTAANGAAALREVMQFDFDVIICDIMMPRMPGDMFYLAVQKTKPELARRFVFITDYSSEPKVETFLKRIDALVFIKPVLTEDLIRMISLVLQRTQSRANN